MRYVFVDQRPNFLKNMYLIYQYQSLRKNYTNRNMTQCSKIAYCKHKSCEYDTVSRMLCV